MNEKKNYDIDKPRITDEVLRKTIEESMHGELEYSMMNDFLTKYTLQNDLYALKGLLMALLQRDEKEIINIEIQARHQPFWIERSLTYLCKNFDHLKSGEDYSKVKPCIHIGILESDIFDKTDERYTGEMYSEYRLQNVKTGTEYSSKFIIKVLLLNHLEDELVDKSSKLYYWARLFKAKSWEELKNISEGDDRMQSYVGTIRTLTEEEKVAMACEARERYMRDIATYEYVIKSKDEELQASEAELQASKTEIQAQKEEIERLKRELAKLQG